MTRTDRGIRRELAAWVDSPTKYAGHREAPATLREDLQHLRGGRIFDMGPTNPETEDSLRRALSAEGYHVSPKRPHGENGVDIIATKGGPAFHIEVIGFKKQGAQRSKDFYEEFFHAVARLDDGACSLRDGASQAVQPGYGSACERSRDGLATNRPSVPKNLKFGWSTLALTPTSVVHGTRSSPPADTPLETLTSHT